MHTNLCIRSVAIYLSWVNISVGYIDGLLDSSYYYPGQKARGCPNHTRNNELTYNYALTYNGWGVHVYDVMRELLKLSPVTREPSWLMYPEMATAFRKYYRK
jgi:hypothetical protein